MFTKVYNPNLKKNGCEKELQTRVNALLPFNEYFWKNAIIGNPVSSLIVFSHAC